MNNVIDTIQEKFGAEIREKIIKKDTRATLVIQRDALLNIAAYMYRDLKFRFIIASAYDSKEGYQIMYHFSYDATGLILNLKVVVPKDNPEIESLTQILNAPNWIEREMNEIMGITFINHPEPKKLISEGNWDEGEYPYRKNFT